MGHGGKECSIVVVVGIKTVKIEGNHLNQQRNERGMFVLCLYLGENLKTL